MKRILIVLCLVLTLCILASCAEEKQPDKELTVPGTSDTTVPDSAVNLVSVDIETLPERQSYYSGETLVTEGMTLLLTYDDGTTESVSEGFNCFPTSFHDTKENGMEEVTVTVTYNEMPVGEFTVSVVDGVEFFSNDFLDDKTENKTELLSNDSYYVVSNIENYTEDTLRLPAFYKGIAVKSVYTLENGNVKKIVLDNGFETLPVRAFQYCEMLEEIVLPASVLQIEPNAVFACSGFKKWAVDADSAYFVSDERGIVYSKDMTVLVMGPKMMTGSSTLAIPEGVTKIAPGAFSYASYVGTLILPKTLTEIGEYAFSDNKGLNIVVIPENVTLVGKNAFAFGNNVYPDEIHCQASKKPDGWASDWINSKASLAVNWNSRYVDWDTLTVR